MKSDKEVVHRIEELVGETRFVDRALSELEKYNPPAGPTRRECMKLAAERAAVSSLGMLSCTQTVVDYKGERFAGWQEHLLKKDLIRGPGLLIIPKTGGEFSLRHARRDVQENL